MKLILIIVVVLFVLFVLFGLYRTYKTQHSANQEKFLAGKVPDPLPNGPYQGNVAGYNGPWQGKSFNQAAASGINNFKENETTLERYPFKTYVSQGFRDKAIQTFKIDYNIPENQFWVRTILDEIVETEPGKYLGKIHLRLLPGLSFAIGYFRLEKL